MERINISVKRPIARELGAGALAKCGSCPLLELCAVKPVPPCEQNVEFSQAQGVQEYDSGPVSYRNALMDDAVPFVAAKRKPAPAPEKVPQKTKVRPKQKSTNQPIVQPKQAPKPSKRLVRAQPAERLGDMIADILGALIGVNGLEKTVHRARTQPRSYSSLSLRATR